METMAEFTPDVVDALNALLEDERASVEMAVALACGATEIAERETLATMGIDDIAACESLRAQMEAVEAPVTRRINGVVFQVLGEERYDDRLRAFAHHQRIVADRCRALLDTLELDDETRDLVQSVSDSHRRHSAWCDSRADVFSATRIAALTGDARQPATDTPAPDAPSATISPDADQQRSPSIVESATRNSRSLEEYDKSTDRYPAAELPDAATAPAEVAPAGYSAFRVGAPGAGRLRASTRIRRDKRVDGA